MTTEEKKQRIAALQHAMQTGIAYMMQRNRSETDPKHLRVGINTALVGEAALADLLMQKGIITEDEYLDALITWTEKEVESYRKALERAYPGTIITLA